MASGWPTLSRKGSREGGGRAGRGHAESALDVSPRASQGCQKVSSTIQVVFLRDRSSGSTGNSLERGEGAIVEAEKSVSVTAVAQLYTITQIHQAVH